MLKHNPFFEDDLIASIARDTESVQSKQAAGLQALLKTQIPETKLNPKSTFNLSQFMSYNFSHFTKFSFAGLAVFALLAGGLSAQALAPDTLKPTQLAQTIKDKYFSANKQSDGDPQVALVPDENNDVVKLKACDFALKFPKEVNNIKTSIVETNSVDASYFEISLGKKISIQCSKIVDDTDFERGNANKIEILNSQSFKAKTGWFIVNDNFKSIKNWETIIGKTKRIIYNDRLIYINTSSDDSILSAIQLQDLNNVSNNFNINENSFSDPNLCNQKLKISYKDGLDVSYMSTILKDNSTININEITDIPKEIGLPQSYTVNISCYDLKGKDLKTILNLNTKNLEQVNNISFLSEKFKKTLNSKAIIDEFSPNTWYIESNDTFYIINYIRPDLINKKLKLLIDLK